MLGRAVLLTVGLLVAATVTAAPAYAAAPTVTSFSPTSGGINAVVTVTGTGFVAPATVRFGGVASATVTVTSATQLTARVPSTAVSGPISVTTTGGTGTSSASFTVLPSVLASVVVGPPTTPLVLAIAGFASGEAVDILRDASPVTVAVTSSGGVAQVRTAVPRDAEAGVHWFTAVGRRSGAAAQVAFTVRTDWAQPGYGAGNTSANPFENQLTPATARQLARRWTVSAGPSTNTTPVVVGGVLYMSFGDNSVRAYTAATGQQLWSTAISTSGDFAIGSPAVAGGLVYVGTRTGSVVALRATTGAPAWTRLFNVAIVGPPVVSGGRVVVAAGTAISALNPTTGATVWGPVVTPNAETVSSPLAVADGRVFVGDLDGAIAAYSLANGAALWAVSTGSGPRALVAADGRLFALLLNGAIVTIDGGTGNQMGLVDATTPPPTTLAYADGLLFTATLDQTTRGVVEAVDWNDGDVVWSATHSFSPTQRIVVAGGIAYVGTATATTLFDASTGRRLRSLPAGVSAPGGVAVSDGAVFVADTTTGGLLRFDLRDTTTPGSSS